MTLTHLGPTAFENPTAPGRACWFLNLGTKAYFRQRPPHMPVGQIDPGVPTTQTATVSDQVTFLNGKSIFTLPATVTATFETRTFPDTGVPPGSGAIDIGDFNTLNTGLSWGFSGTLGFRYEQSSVEITGFTIPNNGAATFDRTPSTLPADVPLSVKTITSTTTPTGAPNSTIIGFGDLTDVLRKQVMPGNQPGRIDLPFFNVPPGFEGNNGLWLQADHVNVSFRSTLGDVEANYRYWPSDLVSVLVGLRYVEDREDVQIFTDDDVLLSGPDPTKSATYRVVTRNRVVLGQLGAQAECPVCPFLGLGVFATGGWGGNFLSSDVSLTRGDGLVGFDGHRDQTAFSQIYEIGAFVNIYCGERCRVHVGYNAFWLIGVAEAVRQIDYDLTQTTGNPSNSASIFYHGPQIELQFMF
jgi:hypothetical protein